MTADSSFHFRENNYKSYSNRDAQGDITLTLREPSYGEVVRTIKVESPNQLTIDLVDGTIRALNLNMLKSNVVGNYIKIKCVDVLNKVWVITEGAGNWQTTNGRSVRFNRNLPAVEGIEGLVKQSSAIADIVDDDAIDLDSAIVLVNKIKSKLNSKLLADRNSGQQSF